MKSPATHGSLLAVLLVSLIASIAASQRAAAAIIYNLGVIENGSHGYAINESGQVTGMTASPAPDFKFRAFRYDGTPGSGGVMHDLGLLPDGEHSVGYAINASGQVAGYADFQPTTGRAGRAFRYTGTPGSGGSMQGLGTLGGARSSAHGINDGGQVVGNSDTASGAMRAFITVGSEMRDLGTLPGGQESSGFAVNESGQVAGWSGTDSVNRRAFRYTGTPGSGGAMADLGTLGGAHSAGSAINEIGQVAGRSHTAGDAAEHAFLYTGTPGSGGVMHDLGTLGGSFSYGDGINDVGQVVGTSTLAGDLAWRAFLYIGTPGVDGQMIDLDAWLDAVDPTEGAKWTLIDAYGLNNNGQITGIGSYDDGPGGLSDGTRAFRLDANSVPEPGGLALLTLIAPVLVRRARDR